jgi:copper transport protein
VIFARWPAAVRRPAISVLLLLAVAALAVPVSAPATVSAHALLQSSDPAAGSTLGSAPSVVTLTYGERPDERLTSVKVLDSIGTDHVSGPIEALSDPPNSLRVPIGALPDGVYTVSWRTVSAVDGHIAAGSFVFGVGEAPPSTPPDQTGGGVSQSGSPPGIVARWILYLGLVALIGAAFVAVAVVKRPVPDLLAMAAFGWVLTAIGTVGVVAVQWVETGAPIEDLPGTSVGVSALARLIALAVVGVALIGLGAVSRLGGRRGWLLVGLASTGGLAVDVVTGHAAAGSDSLPQIAAQWLHGLGAAGWMGGLAALLVALRTTPFEDRLATARRFSFWAGIGLVLVIVTGAIRALVEVGTLEALLGTAFGVVVLLKSTVLLVLAALGAFNRFVTLRNASNLLGRLRRVGGAEITLAVVVLGLSALLVNQTPPTSAVANPAPVAQPIVATGHDFGTSVRARLVATPGAAGSNAFDLALTDYDTSDPVDADGVALRFQIVSQQGVAPSTLELTRSAPGRFSATGANLSIDGIWQLTATVTVGGSAIDVPLLAATTVPAQPVQSLVSAGLPTIYTVQLGGGRTAQVYLDPGGAGQNELHVTFFDPAGAGLPTTSATIAAFPEGGGAAILTPRMLEPGHFVASIDAVAGQLAVDILSPLPEGSGGGNLHVHVTIEVSS